MVISKTREMDSQRCPCSASPHWPSWAGLDFIAFLRLAPETMRKWKYGTPSSELHWNSPIVAGRARPRNWGSAAGCWITYARTGRYGRTTCFACGGGNSWSQRNQLAFCRCTRIWRSVGRGDARIRGRVNAN